MIDRQSLVGTSFRMSQQEMVAVDTGSLPQSLRVSRVLQRNLAHEQGKNAYLPETNAVVRDRGDAIWKGLAVISERFGKSMA